MIDIPEKYGKELWINEKGELDGKIKLWKYKGDYIKCFVSETAEGIKYNCHVKERNENTRLDLGSFDKVNFEFANVAAKWNGEMEVTIAKTIDGLYDDRVGLTCEVLPNALIALHGERRGFVGARFLDCGMEFL